MAGLMFVVPPMFKQFATPSFCNEFSKTGDYERF